MPSARRARAPARSAAPVSERAEIAVGPLRALGVIVNEPFEVLERTGDAFEFGRSAETLRRCGLRAGFDLAQRGGEPLDLEPVRGAREIFEGSAQRTRRPRAPRGRPWRSRRHRRPTGAAANPRHRSRTRRCRCGTPRWRPRRRHRARRDPPIAAAATASTLGRTAPRIAPSFAVAPPSRIPPNAPYRGPPMTHRGSRGLGYGPDAPLPGVPGPVSGRMRPDFDRIREPGGGRARCAGSSTWVAARSW